jgi:hypothetical protein
MKIRNYEISRTLLLLVGVGIFVIALAGLLYLYLGEVSEKNDLEEDLAAVENQIAIIQVDIASSQQKQDELEAGIAQDKAQTAVIINEQLTTSLLSSEIFQNMLTVAGDTNVHLTVIGETAITNGTLGGVSYKLRTISFTVDGSASNIYDFIDELSQDLDTSILNSMGMDTESNPNAPTQATMKLTTYSYK